jgi:type II secretory pathway component PulM
VDTLFRATNAMTERGSDIEFDFFDDEPATEEATQRRRMPRVGPPRGPEGPRRPARPTGLTPLLRLLGLIAAAILVVVLLVFWVQSCRDSGKRKSYETYMTKVQAIASNSEQTGKELNDLLTTPGQKETDVESKLSSYAQQESQNVTQADAIAPPGVLRPAHQHLVEALQFRVSGLRGLSDAFHRTATAKNGNAAGPLLAAQAERLLASDVVYDDLFKDPVRAELAKQGITGVNVPDSNFVQNSDLASARSMTLVWQRVHGASTGGTTTGLHGTGLESVIALPENITLQEGTDNKVTASTDLAFQVTVKDTGDSQEVRVPVVLTIEKSGTPYTATQYIDIIDPGRTKTVTFRKLDVTSALGLRSTVKVTVTGVKGETKLTNNTASYPVFFSIG